MKKFLSILIAISLVISMLPVAFADGAEGEPMIYNLTHRSGDSGNVKLARSASNYESEPWKDNVIERPIEEGSKYYLNARYFNYEEGADWKVLDVANDIITGAATQQRRFRIYEGGYLQLNVAYDSGNARLKIALALKAPQNAGFYVPAVKNDTTSVDNKKRHPDLFLDKVSENKDLEDYTDDSNKVGKESDDVNFMTTSKSAIYTTSLDEIVIALDANCSVYGFSSITLTPILDPIMKTTSNAGSTLSFDLTDGDTANDSQTVALSTKVSGTLSGETVEKPVSNNFITYKSSKPEVAIVAVDGTITAVGGGTATIYAESSDGKYSSVKNGITVTVVAPSEEPEEPGEAVTDTKVSVAVQSENTEEGTVSWNGATIDEVNMGDTITATATAKDGYVFKYWKNAIGQVISEKAEESFVINTNSAITAVFDKVLEDAATVSVELFNANGMPFDNKTVNKDTTFADAIEGVETPSYTGFGAFKHWSMYADESKIADDMLIKKNTRAVAIFNEPTAKYTVKVNGAAEYSNVLYGTEVTVSSDSADFSYWKLGEKVVSYEPNYKFTVWGDVNLVPVTGEDVEAAPVAVLDEVYGNPLLIYSVPTGYTVVEAGILFGSTADITIYSVDGGRAAAARGTGQFTAQPKAGATPTHSRGYLIFKNASGETRILYAD